MKTYEHRIKIYRFQEHDFVVQGEKEDLIRFADLLREAEGTLGDLRYQIEYAFDIDGIRSEDDENDGCSDPNYSDNYLLSTYEDFNFSFAING